MGRDFLLACFKSQPLTLAKRFDRYVGEGEWKRFVEPLDMILSAEDNGDKDTNIEDLERQADNVLEVFVREMTKDGSKDNVAAKRIVTNELNTFSNINDIKEIGGRGLDLTKKAMKKVISYHEKVRVSIEMIKRMRH